VLSTVAIATVFYVLMGYAVMIGFGADAIAKGAAAADPDALGTLAKHYDGWFLRGSGRSCWSSAASLSRSGGGSCPWS
jgi:hypothetical protein